MKGKLRVTRHGVDRHEVNTQNRFFIGALKGAVFKGSWGAIRHPTRAFRCRQGALKVVVAKTPCDLLQNSKQRKQGALKGH